MAIHNYEVIGRTLTHNGKAIPVGEKVKLSEADGDALASRGRLRARAETKAASKAD